jgi:hypothetical protein
LPIPLLVMKKLVLAFCACAGKDAMENASAAAAQRPVRHALMNVTDIELPVWLLVFKLLVLKLTTPGLDHPKLETRQSETPHRAEYSVRFAIRPSQRKRALRLSPQRPSVQMVARRIMSAGSRSAPSLRPDGG